MSVARLEQWDVTAIEIAMDLAAPRYDDAVGFVFSGPAEPRICLVAGFALTSQLKRIVAAVDRSVPARPPSRLRLLPATARSPTPLVAAAVSIQPMLALLRLQSKLIRAIEPGLAHDASVASFRVRRKMQETAARFIGEFISRKTLPAFEPPCTVTDSDPKELSAVGLSIYLLGHDGAPHSILAHWAYPLDRTSIHLRGGP
jgi:hypothetical protein